MMLARRILWLLTALYWAVLFVLTHLPRDRLIRGPSNDKLEHFAAYLVLSLMLGATLWLALPSRRRIVPLIVLGVAAIYGVFDEFTQIPVGRDAELGDWLADVCGAAVAAVVLFLLQFILPRRAASTPDGGGAPLGMETC
jgi:VanZ family protein